MSDEEIVQRFKVEAGNSVEQLGKVDAATKKIAESTKHLKDKHEEHGNSVEKLGKQMLGLEHHHVSARHAMHLLAETTGINTHGIMSLSHSFGMLGPAVGAAAGLMMLMKEAIDQEAEAAQKAKEKTDSLRESVSKYIEARREKNETYEYGKEGSEQIKEANAARATADSIRQRIKESETGKSQGYGLKTLPGQLSEQVGKEGWSQLLGLIPGIGPLLEGGASMHRLSGEERSRNELSGQLGAKNADQAASEAQATRHKRYQEALDPAQDAMREAEMHAAQHGGSASDFKEKISAQKQMIEGLRELAKGAESEAEKKELSIKVDEEELRLQHLRTEAMNKYYTDRIKFEQMSNRPGVFATGAEKGIFSENNRYESEKHEAEQMKKLGFDVDTKALAARHADELKKIAMDANLEITQRQSAIHVEQLRNTGDTYTAELEMASAHYQQMLTKDTGNKTLQELDEEQYNTDIAKLTIQHNNEVASYTANLREESLRIKGDQYGAERDALEEWQRKELEAHKDQAAQIIAVHDQRAADITRREKEEHSKILGGYAVELTGAVLGGGAAGVQRMMLEHNEKQAEYKRTGHADYAAAEQSAYEAKINRMKIESDAGLSSKNRVGFSDIGGAWESFASSLNQNPMQQMQLNEAKATNAILTGIQQDLKATRPELVN